MDNHVGNRHESTNGKKKILLIDDDYLVGNLEKEILEHIGYAVHFETDPIAALDYFQQNPSGFDLVITDMKMPIMMGDELARKITKIREGIPIIMCTGYNMKLSKNESVNQGIKEVIMKPVSVNELKEAVDRIVW